MFYGWLSRMRKKPPWLSLRGVPQARDDEESRTSVLRAGFFAAPRLSLGAVSRVGPALGPTRFTKVFPQPVKPRRVDLGLCVLFLCLGALGLAASAGFAGMAGIWGGQAPADRPPSSSKEKAQIPPSSSGQMPVRSPLQIPGKGEAPAKAAQTGSVKTNAPGVPSIAAGRRDPFKAWVPPSPPGHLLPEPGALPAGTRGLVISGLRLEGIVREGTPNTMIAIVTNYTKRAYFLRVNDVVYNGVVSKITPEAIYFNENTLDSRGRVTTHEVEVKLGTASGEGR